MCKDAKLTTEHPADLSDSLTPAYAKLKIVEHYEFDSPLNDLSPSPLCAKLQRGRPRSMASPVDPFATTEISTLYKTPRFNESPYRMSRGTPVTAHQSAQIHGLPSSSTSTISPHTKFVHKSRLSGSLSHNHELAEHLVPSPLFSRRSSHPRTTSVVSFEVLPSSTLLPTLTLSKPLPFTPHSKPLPALPFQPRPKFINIGNKVVLRPKRTTAIATLIAKYDAKTSLSVGMEDRLMLNLGEEEKASLTSREPTPYDTTTPFTARYKRISDVFCQKTSPCRKDTSAFDIYFDASDDQEVQNTDMNHTPRSVAVELDVATTGYSESESDERGKENQRPTTHHHNANQSSQTRTFRNPASRSVSPTNNHNSSDNIHLALYQTHLASLDTLIAQHITHVTRHISEIHEIRTRHEAEKRARRSTSHVAPAAGETTTATATTTRQAKWLNKTDHRLRSLWSTDATASSSSRGSSSGARARRTGDGERVAEDRKQRMEKLKTQGWRNIRAVAKGYKGKEYYDALIGEIDAELAAY